MKNRRFLYIALPLVLSIALGGCGIKPGHLTPPSGDEAKGFPHTYPDISLDPPPPPQP